MVANGLFSQQKTETKCQGQSFVQNRFSIPNEEPLPTHQQPQPTSRKNNQEHQAAAQKHTQHQAKQPRKATTAQHGTPATPPSKKKPKKKKNSKVKSQNLQF